MVFDVCMRIHHAFILLKDGDKARRILLDICGASSNKSVAEIKCEMHEIILPLLNTHELNETIQSIKNSYVPDFYREIVTQSIPLTACFSTNKTNKIKVHMTVELLIAWIDHSIIANRQVSVGFDKASARLDDLKSDIPQSDWYYVVFVVALLAALAQVAEVLMCFCYRLFDVLRGYNAYKSVIHN